MSKIEFANLNVKQKKKIFCRNSVTNSVIQQQNTILKKWFWNWSLFYSKKKSNQNFIAYLCGWNNCYWRKSPWSIQILLHCPKKSLLPVWTIRRDALNHLLCGDAFLLYWWPSNKHWWYIWLDLYAIQLDFLFDAKPL